MNILYLFLATILGGLLGLAMAMLINCVLIQVSINAFFNLYFGLIFIITSLTLLFRLRRKSQIEISSQPQVGNKRALLQINHIVQLVFCLAVFFSGVLCFTLEEDWFKNYKAKHKIPSYMLLAVSISFALVYSFTDLLQSMIDVGYDLLETYVWRTPKRQRGNPKNR